MESNKTSFQNLRPQLMELLGSREFDNINEFAQLLTNTLIKDFDYRPSVDQLFKEFVLELILDCDDATIEKYVNYVFEAARKEICSTTLPANLLGDIFDMSTLDRCEKLFPLVENNILVWKENSFFTVCKNSLLRMCNDLLRRLSRSQNNIFSGRILLFLAKFFPFSERSGLNIVSEFNVDNVTEFNTTNVGFEKTSKLKEAVEGETDTKIKLDYTVYSKFWSLQDFFRFPNHCYNKPKWNLFCAYTNTILSTFQLFKLDEMSNTEKQFDIKTYFEPNQNYFPKYLTNQRLIELQFADCNFRRYVLVQYLILFQYLNAPVRFKLESFEFKPDQLEWLKLTENKVYKLIEETPPNGKNFSETIRHILQREEHWNNWKNEGCPELKKPTLVYPEGETEFEGASSLPKKGKKIGEFLKEVQMQNKFYLGNRQLAKLWNVNPNNLQACRGKDRNFIPSLQDYFQDVLQEADPQNMIELQYKKVNDKDFTWRGLRLLAKKSPYFFTQNNSPIHKTDEYIENIVSKFLTYKPPSQTTAAVSNEQKVDISEQDNNDFINEDDGEVIEQNYDDNAEVKPDVKSPNIVSGEQLDQVSELIVGAWQDVATVIGYKQDEIEFFMSERQSDIERARYLLQVWSEDSEDPSPENLALILESVNLFEAANVLKQNDDNAIVH